jgi:NADH:ubiquinone oxidoreductase subunit E
MADAGGASSDDGHMRQVCVCMGRTCLSLGADRIHDALARGLKEDIGSDRVSVRTCQCLSFCERGPCVQVDRNIIFGAKAETIAQDVAAGGVPKPEGTYIDTDTLDDII